MKLYASEAEFSRTGRVFPSHAIRHDDSHERDATIRHALRDVNHEQSVADRHRRCHHVLSPMLSFRCCHTRHESRTFYTFDLDMTRRNNSTSSNTHDLCFQRGMPVSYMSSSRLIAPTRNETWLLASFYMMEAIRICDTFERLSAKQMNVRLVFTLLCWRQNDSTVKRISLPSLAVLSARTASNAHRPHPTLRTKHEMLALRQRATFLSRDLVSGSWHRVAVA